MHLNRRKALPKKLPRDGVAILFRLLQETIKPEKVSSTRQRAEEKDDFSHVRCPLCKWRPDKSSRWYCADCDYPEEFYNGCGITWNTFSTRGRCPGCGHQWRWTICLRCQRWSRHLDWYEK